MIDVEALVQDVRNGQFICKLYVNSKWANLCRFVVAAAVDSAYDLWWQFNIDNADVWVLFYYVFKPEKNDKRKFYL